MSYILGTILKGIGGFYYVNTQDGIIECRAKGRFRKEGITPLAGDRVEISMQDRVIEQILPRTNELARPPVANIDALVCVVSASVPKPDFLLIDKLLMYANCANIDVVLCVNKIDMQSDIEEIRRDYKEYMVISVCAVDGTGIEELTAQLRGKCACFAGQSAVGKSSILNAIDDRFELKVGGLSAKTDRGKHTTRHVELLHVSKIDAHIMDTPGFSVLAAMDIEPEELHSGVKEFAPYAGKCRFNMCLHDKEPDCAVKDAVQKGLISKNRYERYLKILNELKERRLRQYD